MNLVKLVLCNVHVRRPFLFKAVPRDWRAQSDGSFMRDLVGGEILMEWFHEQRHGGVS